MKKTEPSSIKEDRILAKSVRNQDKKYKVYEPNQIYSKKRMIRNSVKTFNSKTQTSLRDSLPKKENSWNKKADKRGLYCDRPCVKNLIKKIRFNRKIKDNKFKHLEEEKSYLKKINEKVVLNEKLAGEILVKKISPKDSDGVMNNKNFNNLNSVALDECDENDPPNLPELTSEKEKKRSQLVHLKKFQLL